MHENGRDLLVRQRVLQAVAKDQAKREALASLVRTYAIGTEHKTFYSSVNYSVVVIPRLRVASQSFIRVMMSHSSITKPSSGRTSGGLRGEHAAELVEHPVLRRIKALKMFLEPPRHVSVL